MTVAVLLLFVIVPLVLWACLAAWCASIGESKGRSWGAWFILGLLFSVVALLIVACLSTDTTATRRTDARQSVGRRYRKH